MNKKNLNTESKNTEAGVKNSRRWQELSNRDGTQVPSAGIPSLHVRRGDRQRKIPPRATICLRNSFCDRSLSSSLTMTVFSKSSDAI